MLTQSISRVPVARYSRCAVARVPGTVRSSTRVSCQPSGSIIEEAVLGQKPDKINHISREDLLPAYTSQCPVGIPNTPQKDIKVPTFAADGSTTYTSWQAPSTMKPEDIKRIKKIAIDAQSREFKQFYNGIQQHTSGNFKHPGGVASAAELALLQRRLHQRGVATSSNGTVPDIRNVQEAARDRLLTGRNIPPKKCPGYDHWALPQDTPRKITKRQKGVNDFKPGSKEAQYHGPYPIEKVCIDWGGKDLQPDANGRDAAKWNKAPDNYPLDAGAPRDNISHMCFVELDAQMAIKQAMAYWAATDAAEADDHAQNAFRIIDAWARINKGWDPNGKDKWRNGPLEAGWGIACMARALEMLRNVQPGPDIAPSNEALRTRFVNWVKAYGLKQMVYYKGEITKEKIKAHNIAMYCNWHSTIAEALMSVGILSDDKTMYDDGVNLFKETVKNYIWKWGRENLGDERFKNRFMGETAETLRDIYHTQFGLGGLLQCAEIAWQQDLDLYSEWDYCLLQAMEFHARIILAGVANDPHMLPKGPNKPASDCVLPTTKNGYNLPHIYQGKYVKCEWDGEKQALIIQLQDGKKYLSGVKFLPCGWEVGYNHYAGRLGINMPETRKLLEKFWPEWQLWHWGSGTLTHANTAGPLWRDGL